MSPIVSGVGTEERSEMHEVEDEGCVVIAGGGDIAMESEFAVKRELKRCVGSEAGGGGEAGGNIGGSVRKMRVGVSHLGVELWGDHSICWGINTGAAG